MDSLIAIANANEATLAFEACHRGKDGAGSVLALCGRRQAIGLCHYLSVRTPEEVACQIDDLIEVRFE
jgi:hypothetical protein